VDGSSVSISSHYKDIFSHDGVDLVFFLFLLDHVVAGDDFVSVHDCWLYFCIKVASIAAQV
jgi:hypothetical protein